MIIIITTLLIISVLANIYFYFESVFYMERYYLLDDLNDVRRIMIDQNLSFREACHWKNGSKYHTSSEDFDWHENYYINRAKKWRLEYEIKNLKNPNLYITDSAIEILEL